MQDAIPLVSVIVPSYNHARYIETCLNSIYDDDYSEFEVVVIDDGSSDGSFEIIKKWRENHPGRFRVFQMIQQENQGTCRTANRLVSLAKGEFIALLASDDYLLPGGIRTRVEALSRHREWLAVFGDCILVDEQGAKLGDSALVSLYKANKAALLHPKFITNELILRWSASGPGLMARRACYDPILGIGLYNENLRLMEDRDYYLRLLARNALGFIDFPVAGYRSHRTSVSQRQDIRKNVLLLLWQSNVSHIADFGGLPRLWLRIVSLNWLTSMQYHNNRTLVNTVLHILSSLGVRMAYFIHTLMLALNWASFSILIPNLVCAR